MVQKELFPDPQDLIPIELQQHWLAVPRGAGYWTFVQAFILGAGLALTLGSFFSADRAGWWPAILVAIAVMTLNALLLKKREREWLRTLPKIECPEQEERIEV